MPDLKTSIDSEVVNGAAVPEVVEVDSAPSPGEKETKRRRQSSPEPVPSEGKAKRDERKSVEVRKTKKEEVQEEVMLSSEGDLSDGEIKVVKKGKFVCLSVLVVVIVISCDKHIQDMLVIYLYVILL